MAFEISAGQTQAVVAIGRDADGQPVELTDPTWSSGSTGTCTVAEGAGVNATLTAVAPGATTVSVVLTSVSSPAYTARGAVAVTVPDVSQFTFSEDPLLMDPGDSRTVTATPRDPAGVAHASLAVTAVRWELAPLPGGARDAAIVTITPATGSLAPTIAAVQPGAGTITVHGTRATDHREVTGTLSVRVSGAVSVSVEAGG